MLKKATIVVFWGAAWGLTEATLGHAAHWLTLELPGLTGFFMFPLACLFMLQVYRQTSRPGLVFASSAVAAAIKLIDLLAPIVLPVKVLFPATAILLEGLAVCCALAVTGNAAHRAGRYAWPVVVSAAWRVGYAGLLLLLPPSLLATSPIGSWGAFVRFIVLESGINGLLIALFRVRAPIPGTVAPAGQWTHRLALPLLALALAAQWVL